MTMFRYNSIGENAEFMYRTCIAGLLYFVALTTCAMAQYDGLPFSQGTLNYDQVNKLTSGQSLTNPALGQSTHFKDGTHAFKYEEHSQTVLGVFELNPDGKVCVDFRSNTNRCGIFLKDRGLFFLITKEGDRFPVHFELNVD